MSINTEQSQKEHNQIISKNIFDVEEAYAKDDKLKREDVNTLLQWIKTQHHLPEVKEAQVILALHSCYYNIEAAKKTIDNYFTFRTHYSEYFEILPEDVLRNQLSVNLIKVLPRRTPEDDVVVLVKLLETNPKLFNCIDNIKAQNMILTLHLHQQCPSEGLVLLCDMQGVSFGHIFRMNLLATNRMLGFLQEAAPVRIKALHYMNMGMVSGRLLALVKPFMKKELADLIKLHSTSLESLYTFVPKECLPQDYGGDLPPVEILKEGCAEELLENLDFFKWHETQKVDESKRIKS